MLSSGAAHGAPAALGHVRVSSEAVSAAAQQHQHCGFWSCPSDHLTADKQDA
jgi:hypothetical protein